MSDLPLTITPTSAVNADVLKQAAEVLASYAERREYVNGRAATTTEIILAREIVRVAGMPSEIERRWIPVGERLPEQRIRVLGYDGLMIEDCFYGVSSNRSDADWSEVTWRRTGYEDHFRATHWMPLPEAPK